MSKKNTTGFRLSLYISSALTIVLTIFIILSYQYSKRILKTSIDNHAINLSTEVIVKVRDNVLATQEIASNIADLIPSFAGDNRIEFLSSRLIKKYPFVQAIHVQLNKDIFPQQRQAFFIARKDNEFVIRSEPENSDVCTCNENETLCLLESEKYGWSDPYHCKLNDKIVSSYSMPILIPGENGGFTNGGTISVELSLSYLNTIISNTKVGERGYAFLISQNGTFITHPDETRILTKNILHLEKKELDSSSDSIKTILARNQSGSTIAYPEYLNYKKCWVYYTPIVESNWTLIIIRPYKELYFELRKMLTRLIAFSILGLAIIFILVNFIISKLMNPLSELISDIHTFSHGIGKTKSKNEVESLDKSLHQLQIWVERNKLSEEQAKQQFKKFSIDLEQASEIQQSIIPNTFPPFPERKEIEIFSIYKPALVISGDLYDYFFVDDDHLLIAIGDVSGKGIPAAMFMGVAHTLLRGRSFERSASQVATEINDELVEKNQNQFFLTLFVGILNVKTGVLNYCNAAHTSSKIVRSNGDIEELSAAHGLPLGLYTGRPYHDSSTMLEPNDSLILYTDGVTDLMNQYSTHYGEKRFMESLKGSKDQHPIELVETIEENYNEFRKDTPLPDDLSMVILKFRKK